MGLVQRDGIQRLTHAKRYSRFFSTICVKLSDTGFVAGHGKRWGVPATEIGEHSDLVVVWGTNPVHTHVNLMTHVARARKERGAKLVVVDPYFNATAEQADMHLALRPGTDGALACGVMHVLFKEGYADRDYLARYSDVPDELERHLASRTPEWAAAVTGLKVEEILAFARLYGRAKRSYLRLGYGFTRSRNGAASMHAATCLPVVTGAWQHAGGGALYNFGDLYRFDKTMIEGLDVVDPSVRILDQSRIGPILCGDRTDLGDGPPVTALLIQNTNPACVAPDLGQVRRGFAREDLFVAVHEQFMTDTAKMADIVLPATMFLEHDDVYQAAAHPTIQVHKGIFAPFAESRPNHFVHQELARRLGAEHPGFAMSEWELIDDLLARSGWPDAETVWQAGGWEVLPDFATAHHLGGFPNPDGRFRFAPDWATLGPRGHEMPRAARPAHGDRRRHAREALPAGRRPRAAVPQHQLHRDADLAKAGGAADRPPAPRDHGPARPQGRRPGPARQREGLGTAPHQGARRPEPDHDRGREHLAERLLGGGRRHQPPDQRRAGPAGRRRRVPRHGGVAGARGRGDARCAAEGAGNARCLKRRSGSGPSTSSWPGTTGRTGGTSYSRVEWP